MKVEHFTTHILRIAGLILRPLLWFRNRLRCCHLTKPNFACQLGLR